MQERKRVLCLGAHPDDIEFGCGATLHKHVIRLKDWHAYWLTFTQSMGEEAAKVSHMNALSMGAIGVSIKTCRASYLYENRQAVWEEMRKADELVKPDLILSHDPDYHQDHRTVYEETMRNFHGRSVLLYGIARSQTPEFEGHWYEQLMHDDVQAKLKALDRYRPLLVSDGLRQVKYDDKAYFDVDAITGKMRHDGVTAGCSYAEVFRVARFVSPHKDHIWEA